MALSACGGGGGDELLSSTAGVAESDAAASTEDDGALEPRATILAQAVATTQASTMQWSGLTQAQRDAIRNSLVTFAATDLQLEGVARAQMGEYLTELAKSNPSLLQKFVDGLAIGKTVGQSAKDTDVLARFSPRFDLKEAWSLFTKNRPCDQSAFYDYECKYVNNTMYLLHENSLDMEAYVNALADTKTQQSGWQFILANGPANRDLEIEYRRGMYRVLLQVQRFDKYRAKGEFANATVAYEKLKPLAKTFKYVIDDVLSVKKKKV